MVTSMAMGREDNVDGARAWILSMQKATSSKSPRTKPCPSIQFCSLLMTRMKGGVEATCWEWEACGLTSRTRLKHWGVRDPVGDSSTARN